MEEVQCNNWEVYNERVCKPALDNPSQDIWFRGQPDSQKPLESTLYRIYKSVPLYKYLNQIGDAVKEVEAFTGYRWDLDFFDFYYKRWNEITSDGKPDEMRQRKRIVEYMAYLRHFGYPSPFLDWSASPYVAAFFAFSGQSSHNSKNVTIYSYQEYIGTGKYNSDDDGKFSIETVDYPLGTHRRHYLQQGRYIIALEHKNKDSDLLCSFEEAQGSINKAYNNSQDVVKKYMIPSSERKTVLQYLEVMNINYMSLFSDEQNLIKTLALRYELKNSC